MCLIPVILIVEFVGVYRMSLALLATANLVSDNQECY